MDCSPCDQGKTDERISWAKHMRQSFSPPAMLLPDGSIDQGFFKPKAVVILNERKWGDTENRALLQGLQKYGVGSWFQIGQDLLHGWDDQQLRVRTCRLLGTQSLVRFVGWKGDAQAVQWEYDQNRAIGEATGCWKGGMLVEDDKGSVKLYIAQQQKLGQGMQGQGVQEQGQGMQGRGQVMQAHGQGMQGQGSQEPWQWHLKGQGQRPQQEPQQGQGQGVQGQGVQGQGQGVHGQPHAAMGQHQPVSSGSHLTGSLHAHEKGCCDQ